MITSGTEFGLKIMRAVGAQLGVTYLSAPISTGRRDLMLMQELGVGKEELRAKFPGEHRRRVIGPNEREVYKFAQMVRKLPGRGFVVNPGELYVPSWTQSDYIAFWEEIIRSFCLEMVLAPGWEYSAGARFEAGIALQTNLTICDVRGRELSARDLSAMDGRARSELLRQGLSPDVIEAYMPWVDFTSLDADPARLAEHIQQFSDIAVRHNEEALRRQRESEGDQSA
jgi:hypothetical protein